MLLGWLWAVLAGPFRRRLAVLAGESASLPFPRRKAVLFYAALLIFYVAVGSPLDQIAEGYLLSAHMLQHQLLIYPAAICFLLGIPAWMIDPFLGPLGMRIGKVVTRPLICAVIFLLVFGSWHAPAL